MEAAHKLADKLQNKTLAAEVVTAVGKDPVADGCVAYSSKGKEVFSKIKFKKTCKRCKCHDVTTTAPPPMPTTTGGGPGPVLASSVLLLSSLAHRLLDV